MVDTVLRPPAPAPVPPSDGATPTPAHGRSTVAVALVLAVVAFAIYWVSPVRLQTDSYWTVFSARSLVRDGDLDLREYRPGTDRVNPFQIEHDGAARYYRAPLVATLTAVPLVAAASVFDRGALDRSLREGHTQPYDGIAAALVAALTVALLFLVVRHRAPQLWVAVVTTIVFAFGTQMWSTASRTTWMHGPSILFLTAALYCATRARSAPAWFGGLGACLALAYFARPTNAVPALALGLWALSGGRPALRKLATGVVAVVAGVFALNLVLLGQLLQPYFQANRLSLSGTTVEALVGNLVSPSRGYLVFVPVALLAVAGFLRERRTGRLDRLDVAIAAAVVGYWIAVSLFPHWYAGYTYGPRFLADVAPLVVWFLPPVFVWAADAGASRRAGRVAVVALVVAASIAIQARGAIVQETAAWNWTPHDIDLTPGRVWDWGDPQFLR